MFPAMRLTDSFLRFPNHRPLLPNGKWHDYLPATFEHAPETSVKQYDARKRTANIKALDYGIS